MRPLAAAGDVLANDTDVDAGDTQTVVDVNGAAGNVGATVAGTYGTLTLNSQRQLHLHAQQRRAVVQALARRPDGDRRLQPTTMADGTAAPAPART